MRISINNLDYTAGLDGVRPLVIERKLNAPSVCRLWVALGQGSALAAPMRNQALVVSGDDGTLYFTGYLAVSPFAEYVGVGVDGPKYRWELEAVSDEILLDTQLLPPSAGATGVTAGNLLKGMVARTGATALATSGLTLATQLGNFVPEAGRKFSEVAGQAATEVRAAYRAVNGALTLATVGTVVHALSEGNGTLSMAGLTLTPRVERALANDVTVCGADEPVAYVTEYLLGDGVTLLFPLTEAPFFGPTAQERVIRELFQEAAIDRRRWGFAGNPAYFSITGAGLTLNGGNGIDGQAALVWNDAVEAGGTLLVEAVGVNLSPGSAGTVAGLYSGDVLTADCVAGFQVTSATGTGVVSLAPLVQGAVAGARYVLNPAHGYTLRMRVHCAEVERVTQAYRTTGDSGTVLFGGGGVVATANLLMEIEEFVNGVAGMPVVLYDGAIGSVPGSYTVAAASSLNLIGSMRSLFIKRLGTGWVTSVAAGGAIGSGRTRRLGSITDGGECVLSRTGFLTFYKGLAPALGEKVVVRYRTVGRAVGRAVNAASQAALQAVGNPPVAVWTGSVTAPVARSSRDCRNAAQALVAAASSVSAAWSGEYKTTNVGLGLAASGDVWPGDALGLTAPSLPLASGGGLNAQVVVRQVRLEYGSTVPDVVRYTIEFSNDWANDLSVKTSLLVPADALLPAVVGPTYLANLTGLTVTAITATAVTVTTGVAAPTGGGFEVRRRDFAFGASPSSGQDVDLVIRSVVETFDIPRATESDRFFVRMFDGAVPANYSEFSVGLFVNLPLAS